MTKLSQLCTAGLLLGTLLPGSALAHSTPYTHYHANSNKKRVKVVYRTTPAAPTRVVIVKEKTVIRPRVIIRRPTVVIQQAAASEFESTSVMTEADRSAGPDPFLPLSIGVRALGAQTSMEDGAQGEIAMGGAGITIRSKLPDGFGVELSADVLAGEDAGFMQTSVPVFASASYHFLPDSFLQPYAVAGVGAEFSRREFLDGRYIVDRVDIGIQAGLGAELFLTRSISLTTDVRVKAMGTVKRDSLIRDDCISESGGMTGFCDGLQTAATGGDASFGVQVGVGANIYF